MLVPLGGALVLTGGSRMDGAPCAKPAKVAVGKSVVRLINLVAVEVIGGGGGDGGDGGVVHWRIHFAHFESPLHQSGAEEQ